MIPRFVSVFARPELSALARDELALLGVYARRLAPARALIVHPHASALQLPLDLPETEVARLYVQGGRLEGDQSCLPHRLPWAEGSFDLVQVQHVGEVLAPVEAFVAEIERVTAPGGVVLWSGLNALGAWHPWCRWRHEVSLGRLSAARLRRLLAHSGLDVETAHRIGAFWPRDAVAGVPSGAAVDLFRAAWVLAANKRRIPATLLPHRATRVRAVPPRRLAAAASRRASA
ncbi:MAG TPA: methyltransferase domain-containing protein [Dokdonella sp.]|uniref:methyltransferase domain-containing protein n=1 Tax=Dokdonella sp. TaxID=2291710 RepID=UPI002CF264AA|nr:methyltransferase domain-containing protein [Dokdonella sp.]HUD42112.1 methyltransferase domain-containing protein [Dokdonella sp.]